MGILRDIAGLFSSTFKNPRLSATGDDFDDDECSHHSNAGIRAMRSRRKNRHRAESDFNLANIKIPVEGCVMDARHAWQQELIPGYGAQSDIYISHMLAGGAVTTRENLLATLYQTNPPLHLSPPLEDRFSYP